MHKLGAALVVAVLLALLASAWAVLEVQGVSVDANDRTLFLTSLVGAGALLAAAVLSLLLGLAMRRASESELRLRHIFQGAAVAITEECYGGVALALDQLKAQGVKDLRAHLAAHPDLLQTLVSSVEIRGMNPAMRELIELEDGAQLHSLTRFFLPDTMPVLRDALIALYEGQREFRSETVLRTSNGRIVQALVTLSYPADLAHEPVVVTLTDISARKREEQRSRAALEHSEARLRAVFDQCPVGITMSNLEGRIDYVNPTARSILEPAGERLGKRGLDALSAEDRERITRWRDDFIHGRTLQSELTLSIQAVSGGTRTLRVQANLLRENEQVSGIVSTIEDITEHLRLEEQLRQVQKMEAVGQLAGGVAHDFNNLLTVILNGAGLLQAGATKEQAELLEQVEAAAERASSLTAQLLAFGRKQVLRPRVVDLNDLVSNHCRMLQRLVGEKIRLDTELEPNGALAEVDPNLIELLLMNLVVNARDAMPLGGQIMIALDCVVADKERGGAVIHLSVRDTGSGIEPANVPHVFEPFFTTKAVGKGTGLGLATVYGIVEQHQGKIEVETTLGSGTTFHIFLPRSEAKAAPASESLSHAPDGHETLLLVEDEPAVRQMVAASLVRCGYRVIEASDGDAAFDLWRTHKEQIDLLLTDIVMPGSMSGRDLALRLRAERPQLKVVYMSGYGAQDAANEPWSILVQKPFQLSTLAQVLRARLDAKESSMRLKPVSADAASKQRRALAAPS
jgi:PAS domain S-box-containing protein